LSPVAWFKLHGIVKRQVSSSHDTSWYRRTAIHRDIGDTGIAKFGITILTGVSPVSHNTTVERQSINSAPAL